MDAIDTQKPSYSDAVSAISQRKRWVGEAALASLCEHMPGFAGLALWLRHVETLDEKAFYAATDGVNVFYGQPFRNITHREQMCVQAHEILHAALQHPTRFKAMAKIYGARFDHKLCNVVADAIINTALAQKPWFRLSFPATFLEPLLTEVRKLRGQIGLPIPTPDPCDRKIHEWSLETLYAFVDTIRQEAIGAGIIKELTVVAAGDNSPLGNDVRPADNPTPQEGVGGTTGPRETLSENAIQDRMKAWNKRLLGVSASHDAGGIIRALSGDLPKVRTPWEQHLRNTLTSALTIAMEATWTRPNRRGLAAPGWKRSKPSPRLVIIIDTSGSIDKALLRRFAAETQAIVLKTGAEVTLISCDAEVTEVVRHRTFDIAETIRQMTFKGGGGTSFAPAIAEAAKHKPDAVVYLTDLQGDFGEPPRFQVLWAVPEQMIGQKKAPFGQLIPLL